MAEYEALSNAIEESVRKACKGKEVGIASQAAPPDSPTHWPREGRPVSFMISLTPSQDPSEGCWRSSE